MPLNDNLLSAFRFSESGGTTTDDEGPANNNGTLVGTAALAAGRVSFATGPDRVTISPVTLSNSWTICFRGRQNTSGTAGVLCGNLSANTSFMFFFGGSLFRVALGGGAERDFTGVTTFTTLRDYAVVYDAVADTLSLYVDGSLIETKTGITNGTFVVSGIGSGITGNIFGLIGEIDYFYIFERALNSTDVASVDTDPDSVLTGGAGGAATSYTLTGPSSGGVGVASTNFTVTPNGTSTATVTPASSGSGTFTPSSVTFDGTNAAKTFTYTPASTSGSPHTISVANDGGLANPTSLTYTVSAGTIAITSPVTRRVFQRSGAVNGIGGSASVTIAGTYTGTPTSIEWSVDGTTWNTLAASPSGGTYSGSVSVPAGQYTLRTRFGNDVLAVASVALVGVGDIIGILGQSNASGQGSSNQAYSSATGLTASKYNTSWADCTDPTDPNDGQGSPWPHLATAWMAYTKAPLAIMNFGISGVSITVWNPSLSNYQAYLTAASAIGPPLATLWWQGETDAIAAMSQATYNGHLDTIANALATTFPGHKLFPCRLQNSTGIADAAEEVIRAAIDEAVADNPNVAAGPDLSAIATDDAYHPRTTAKMIVIGQMWWMSLYSELFAPQTGSGANTAEWSAVREMLASAGVEVVRL